jgi:nitroreductase
MRTIMNQAQAFADLMQAHRSIRSFKSDPLPEGLIDHLLLSALHGTSSSGNLNMISVVKTQNVQRKAHLYELHGEQPMVLQAPLVLTFCADSFRTREWLALRGARPGFADFTSWHVASFDAMILAQTVALACESQGLGICYMGTTLFALRAIADYLELPPNCLPVTSLVVGWPAEAPTQRDRLPAAAWIHDERYQRPSAADIEAGFAERESRGRARYMDSSPEMAALWNEHGITSLAQYYTSKIKYDPDLFAAWSTDIEALLRERGFL